LTGVGDIKWASLLFGTGYSLESVAVEMERMLAGI